MKYLQTKVDITHLSNFKTPAIAEFYFEIHTIEDLEKLPEIYKFAQDNDLDFLCI